MSTKLNPWESPTAPASPLWACCTSEFGPVCGHAVTLFGPAHFRPVYVKNLSKGDVADMESAATGEVTYHAVSSVWAALHMVYVVAINGTKRPMHAYDALRVAGTDAVTRRRIADAGVRS